VRDEDGAEIYAIASANAQSREHEAIRSRLDRAIDAACWVIGWSILLAGGIALMHLA
jgi:hypothetical protein